MIKRLRETYRPVQLATPSVFGRRASDDFADTPEHADIPEHEVKHPDHVRWLCLSILLRFMFPRF